MRFSIITVTKNNKTGLLRAIECVRNQTYKSIEHIIVDGGSDDGTAEILKQIQDKAQKDSLLTNNYLLRTISEADSGIYDAINKGIKMATGDVIGLLHSDDLYAYENVLEKYASVFNAPTTNNKQNTVEAVYSDLVYVRKKREGRSEKSETTNYSLLTTNYSVIRYWKAHKTVNSNQSSVNSENTDNRLLVTDHLLQKGWMPPHPTLFVRKEVFEKHGLYNTSFKIAADYEMILRLFYKHKITAHYLPYTTYLMSIGGTSNKSINNIVLKSKEDLLALKLHNLPHPLIALLSKNLRKLPQFLARDLS